jgi:hypothetical protein
MNRLKLAELTSSVGALVLGIGLGVFLTRWIGGSGESVVLAGAVLHGWGMWDKHRLESGALRPPWSVWLYWFCWLGLGVVLAVAVVRTIT